MEEGQLGREPGEPAQIAVRESVLDFVITVFHVPQRVQFFWKTAQPPLDSRLRSAKEQSKEGSMGRNLGERAAPRNCQYCRKSKKTPPLINKMTGHRASQPVPSIENSPNVDPVCCRPDASNLGRARPDRIAIVQYARTRIPNVSEFTNLTGEMCYLNLVVFLVPGLRPSINGEQGWVCRSRSGSSRFTAAHLGGIRTGRRLGLPRTEDPLSTVAVQERHIAGAPLRGHRQLRENGGQVRRPGLDHSQGIEDRLRSTHLEMSGRVPRVDPADPSLCPSSEGPPAI